MGRPVLLPKPWLPLVEAAGGVARLADELGVDTRTIRRWAHGDLPVSKIATIAIKTIAAQHRVKAPVK